jgi:hypothetical protein
MWCRGGYFAVLEVTLIVLELDRAHSGGYWYRVDAVNLIRTVNIGPSVDGKPGLEPSLVTSQRSELSEHDLVVGGDGPFQKTAGCFEDGSSRKRLFQTPIVFLSAIYPMDSAVQCTPTPSRYRRH